MDVPQTYNKDTLASPEPPSKELIEYFMQRYRELNLNHQKTDPPVYVFSEYICRDLIPAFEAAALRELYNED